MTHNETLLQQARVFRDCMGQPNGGGDRQLQQTLISEEYWEFLDAPTDLEALKELADLVFVCYQYAAAVGWDLDVAMRRVFESNMSKLVNGKPLKRADGKVIKGPNYRPPVLDDLV